MAEFDVYFKYLDDLRDSGEVNMFGALPYLVSEFGLSKSEAQRALIEWMRTYDKRHPQEER